MDVSDGVTMMNDKPEVKTTWYTQYNYATPPKQHDFLRINISGVLYITLRDTIEEFPATLLGNEERRQRYFVESLNAYFFDRNRDCFEAILHYYQSSGMLFRPTHIPMEVFVKEVRFFGISEDVICNLHKLEGHRQHVDDKEDAKEVPKKRLQRKLWLLMEVPDSSLPARIIACVSILVILVSITIFCLETLPGYHDGMASINMKQINKSATNTESVHRESVIKSFHIMEQISVAWFLLEYLLRFISSPNKWKFVKSFANMIDLIAILPFFVAILCETNRGSSLAVVRVIRLARIFRVFKLSRHSLGLQILGSTLKASFHELGMMLCVLSFSVILFSSVMYYAEHGVPESMFESIPAAFWYTLITTTTVGYGDVVPVTIIGKMIGGLCAITGVLTVAMVIPIIVTNFEFFYKRDRINVAQQEQKMMSSKHCVRKSGRCTARPENDSAFGGQN